jgi:hypothetical protein
LPPLINQPPPVFFYWQNLLDETAPKAETNETHKSQCVAPNPAASAAMGAGFSSAGAVEIPANTGALLSQFAGPATRTHSDPMWQSLLSSCDETPLVAIDPNLLDRGLRPTCVALCKHTRNTAHLTTLLQHASRLLRAVRADMAEPPVRATNIVVFATCLLKHHVEFSARRGEAWREACSRPPSEGGSAPTPAVMRSFLETVVHTLAKKDSPSKHLYALHLVCVRCLTTVCATALFDIQRRDETNANTNTNENAKGNHPGFEVLAMTCVDTRCDWVRNRASVNSGDALVHALLSRVGEREGAPKLKNGKKKRAGALFTVQTKRSDKTRSRGKKETSLATRFANAFSFVTGDRETKDNEHDVPAPLADACCRLLSVLVTFPVDVNVFLETARAARSASETVVSTTRTTGTDGNGQKTTNRPTQSPNLPSVDFASLIKTLSARVAVLDESGAHRISQISTVCRLSRVITEGTSHFQTDPFP